MIEIKRKIVTLKEKGEEGFIYVNLSKEGLLSSGRLMINLNWTAKVDMDLMAFYRTNDGQAGGVFSDRYPGGSLGSIEHFPYIELSGDEGIGISTDENDEVIHIARLDHLSELYIVTLNYTDAVEQKLTPFKEYDGTAILLNDRGESAEIRLDSEERGHIAVVCKIDNAGTMGAKLINMSEVMTLEEFVETIPGASLLVHKTK